QGLLAFQCHQDAVAGVFQGVVDEAEGVGGIVHDEDDFPCLPGVHVMALSSVLASSSKRIWSVSCRKAARWFCCRMSHAASISKSLVQTPRLCPMRAKASNSR